MASQLVVVVDNSATNLKILERAGLCLHDRVAQLPQLHAQNRPAAIGLAGERCALNLAGIEKSAIERGDWVVDPRLSQASERVDVMLTLPALLLVVVGYQNVVTYPHLQGELAAVNRPQILASASLINANTRGTDKTVVSVRRGEPFLLFLDIPGDARFSSYMAELQGPNENSVWSLAVPGEATKDTIPIRVPGDHHEAGMYTLMVRGIDSSGGKGSEIGRYPFELQVRN